MHGLDGMDQGAHGRIVDVDARLGGQIPMNLSLLITAVRAIFPLRGRMYEYLLLGYLRRSRRRHFAPLAFSNTMRCIKSHSHRT